MINHTKKTSQPPRLFSLAIQHLQAIKVSINQLGQSPIATIITFLVIGIALAFPMGLYVFLQNFQAVSHGLNRTTQISAYLNVGTTQHQADNLIKILQNDQSIKHVRYISPKEGLDSFKNDSGISDIVDELKDNPIPGVLIIQPGNTLKSTSAINELVTRIQKLPAVNSAELDMHWLQRLNAIILICHRFVLALMILFGCAVFLTVGNTMKLITQNHCEEISVIKLFGGTNQFIRRPFLYSGIIYGLTGAIFAWLLVDFALWWLKEPIQQLAQLYSTSFLVKGLDVQSTLYLLVVGCILGYLGSWIAVNRYIKSVEPH